MTAPLPNHVPAETDEASLRTQLGIPQDAERVIVFAESSHWDPDWLLTSEQYYDRFVQHNLDRALEELLDDPRRIYSIECVFFLRTYWERRPEQQSTIRSLVNEGRLRLTSSGVTTADTLLPTAEAILRDLLIGQEWLRANGMTQEPRLAYFADSFGCSPALPSLLNAAGFDRTAITRIDGMYFVGADYEPRGRFPRPGSSAALLLKQERTLDFVWRDMNGAQVLCHWNAYTYGQGDLLTYRGLSRIYLYPFAIADRSERNVARRIQSFAAQLIPYGRTPYLFCPIGFDFVEPIPGLVSLLDRYNGTRYPTTGVWAVNAGLDDYMALLAMHRQRLPVLELDPNPYWTGFYTSRPTLKRRCHRLVDLLVVADRLAAEEALKGNGPAPHALDDAWWTAAVSNHHDFITGTSPDPVVYGEQVPWLERATQAAQTAIDSHPRSPAPAAGRTSRAEQLLAWRRQGDRIEVRTPHYVVELSEAAGGGIARAWQPDSERPLLTAVANDLVSYRDSGGLWRMGHEYRGGAFRETERASARSARLEVHEHDDGLEIDCRAEIGGLSICRRIYFRPDSPLVRFRVEGQAAEGHTVAIRFPTPIDTGELAMDAPGGVVSRPLRKIYDPTYWPAHSFTHLRDRRQGRGVVVCHDLPTALSCRADGTLELVVFRNATKERAFGLLPLLANPASGHERDPHALDYALAFTSSGDWRANELPAVVQSAWDDVPWADPTSRMHRHLDAVVTTDHRDVMVTAIKPATRGQGLIVRLSALACPTADVTLSLCTGIVKAAHLCDARERDIRPLQVSGGSVHLTMPGSLATVRLLI